MYKTEGGVNRLTGIISGILGEYTYHFIVISSSLPSMLFAAALFSLNTRKKKHFFLRLVLGLLIVIAINIGLAVLRTHHENIYTRIIVYICTYLCLLPLFLICCSDSLPSILLNWCAAMAVDDIGSRAFTLLTISLGKTHWETISLFSDSNEFRDWLIFYLFRFGTSVILHFIFRRAKCLETDGESIRNITVLSLFFTVWIVIFQAVSRQYMQESTKLYAIAASGTAMLSLTVLVFRTGILSQNQYRLEIAMLDKLLSEERKQYDAVKENIDIVNMRCHDLKHQLEDLSYKLTEGEIVRLKEAIKIYDNNIKTGNEALDVVIYEKQLVFQKEGIRFTCIADGSSLKFMRTTHIYALFNNALGNALEALRKLSDPEKKIIDLCVKKSGGIVEITVTNYFNGEINENNATTKDNKSRHGFGIKSMKYIAEQYGGTLSASAEGEVFELTCWIPIPNAAE